MRKCPGCKETFPSLEALQRHQWRANHVDKGEVMVTDGGRDTASAGSERSPTFLRQRGIRKRMWCSGQIAHQIEKTFVTVEQLVEAVKSDQELTEWDGIGPKTAEVIGEWWQERFKREEKVEGGEVERTGRKTATIHFYTDWTDAIGDRSNTDSSQSQRRGEDG